MLKFEYRLTEQDLLEMGSAYWRSRRVVYLLLWLISLYSLWTATNLLLAYLINGRPVLLDFLYHVMAAGILVPEYQISPFQRWRIKRFWRKNINPQNPIAIEVTEAGLTRITPNISSQINWHLFHKFVETPNLFVVYQSPQLFYIFPKRSLASAAQIDEFRSLLQTHIQPRSR